MPAKDTPKRRKKETFTISFRVDSFHLGQLEKGARRSNLSVHEYARERLIDLLERQDEARILEETASIRQGVESLRLDVAATLEMLLLNLTEADSEQIRVWIDGYLRPAADSIAEE